MTSKLNSKEITFQHETRIKIALSFDHAMTTDIRLLNVRNLTYNDYDITLRVIAETRLELQFQMHHLLHISTTKAMKQTLDQTETGFVFLLCFVIILSISEHLRCV